MNIEYRVDGVHVGRHTQCPGIGLKPIAWFLLVTLGSLTLPEQSLASTYSPGNCNVAAGVGPDGLPSPAGANPTDGSGVWSNVVGCNASGGGLRAVQVIGYGAKATGDAAVALGYSALSAGRGTAVGMDASATGLGSTALGQWAAAAGSGSVAIGGYTGANDRSMGASASGEQAVAIGGQSIANRNADVALGWSAQAQSGTTGSTTLAATALGAASTATGLVSTATGYKANANGTAATALGGQAQATANYATAVGTTTVGNSGATGVWSSALGTNANATADGATAVGARAAASGVSSIAIGSNNNPTSTTDPSVTSAATDSIAIGNRTSATSGATEGVAIGASSSVSAANAAAIGYRATASGAGSLALGGNATGGAAASATDSLAFGGQSSVASGATSGIAAGRGSSVAAAATYGIAMGDAAAAKQANDIAIGRNAATNASSAGNNIAVGNGVTTGANGQNVAMGSGSTTSDSRTSDGGAVAIGRSQKATGDGAVALGDPNTANGDGATAIGANNTAAGSTDGSTAANGAVAIGNSNQAIGQGAVALGNASKAEAAGGVALGDTADAKATNGVAMGSGSTATNANDVALGSNSNTATAVGTANTTINGTTYSFAGTNPGSTVSVGASGSERTITNVAAGRLSGSSTDAVNGSQLYATNQAVGTLGTNLNNLGNSTASAIGGGMTYSSSTGTLSQPSYNIAGGTQNNISDAINALNQGWTLTTAGNTSGASDTAVQPGSTATIRGGNNIALTQNGSDITVATSAAPSFDSVAIDNGGPTLSSSGIDMSGQKIANLANGTASGDAVNVSQLNSLVNGGTRYFHANSTKADSNPAGTDSVAVGPEAVAQNDGDAAFGLNASTANGQAGDVALGSGSKTAAVVGTSSTTINGENYDFAGTAPKSTVSVGDAGAERTVTNVAAGRLSDSSTDAVNGSQLYATNSAINTLGTQVNNNTTNLQNLGNSTASVLGGNASYDATTGTLTTSNIGGTGQGTVDGAISSINATANKGWNVTTAATGSGVANGTSVANVKPGDTATITAGDNLITTQNGTEVAIGLNPILTGLTSLALANGPAISSTGIDMGDTKISHLANGTDANDAVNVSQLDSATGNLTSAGLNFTDASGKAAETAHVDLGGTLPIIGATTQAATGLDTSGTATSGSYSAQNLQTYADATTGKVQVQMADNPNFTSVTTGNTVMDTNGLTVNGGANPVRLTSIGLDNGGNTITNVAAGSVAAGSTDAVNGDQLNTTNQNVATNASNLQNLGTSTASGLGGNSNYNSSTGQLTTSLSVGGTTYTNVNSALDAINSTASKGWNVTTSAAGSGVANSTSVANVKPGDTATITADNNIITTQNGTEVAIGLNPALTGLSSLALANGPAISSTGIDMGNTKISHLASGTDANDAVNVGQLDAATGNLTSAGLNFTDASGKSGETAHVDLGGTLPIIGATTQAATGLDTSGTVTAGSYSAHNLQTYVDATTGKIQVQLADNPNFTSVTTGNTVMNTNGVTVSGGTNGPVSLTNTGLDNGGNTITNVAAGSVAAGSTDAVNGDQLYAVRQAANAGWQASADNGTAQQITPNGAVKFTTGGDTNLAVSQTNTTANANQATIQVQLAKNLDLGSTGSITTGNTSVSNDGVTISGGANGSVNLTNSGLDNGDNTLTHVAAGSLDENSTDAVNGNQLYTTNQNVATNASNLQNLGNSTASVLGGNASYDATTGTLTTSNVGGTGQDTVDGAISSINATANKGWNVTTAATGSGVANGTSVANVKPGDTATITAGDNIVTTQNGTEVAIGLNPALTGLTSLALANGPAISSTGIDMGDTKISRLANGTDANDAVNVSQLQAVASTANNSVQYDNADKTSVTLGGATSTDGGVTDGTTITNVHQGAVTSTSTDAVNGSQLYAVQQAANAGWQASADNGTTQQITPNGAVKFTTGGDTNLAVSQTNATANANQATIQVQLAKNLDLGSTGSVTTGDTSVSNNGVTVSGGTNRPVSLTNAGLDNGGNTITNVAAGNVAAGSTDAVNGDQLNTTNQNVATNASNLQHLGNSAASALGGNASYDATTGTLTTSNVGGTGQDTVDGAISSINATANKGWNVTTAATGSGVANGTSVANVKPGDTATITAGDNLITTQNGTEVAIGLNPTLTGLTSVTTGNSTLDSNGLSVNDGTNSATYGAAGLSIANGPSVTVAGIDAGNQKITNVANGTGANDAVNVSQLQAVASTANNSVQYDNADKASVTLGGAASTDGGVTDGTTITNVHQGAVTSNSTDAVNGSQLYATNQNVVTNASNLQHLGNSAASALGGNASYDATTGTLTTSNIGGTGQDTVDGAISSINATANKGWNVTTAATGSGVANGTSVANVKPGDTATITAGDNLITTQNGTEVAIGLNPTLTGLTSVTTGNSTLDSNGLSVNDGTNSATYGAAGLSIANGPSVTVTGINAGKQKITNVAAGDVSATSADAVNGSQLYATNQSINNITNGKAGAFQSDNSVTGTAPVASGMNATAGGFGASATGAASTVIGNNATDNGVANSTVLGQGASIASGTTGSNVALGQGSTVTAAAVPTSSGTINGTTYAYAGGTPAGVVSVGSAGNERQVTNVAAGQITATSTDAVNGSQLYATNQAIAAVGATATNLGSSAAAGLGGNSSYDASTGQLTTSLSVDGNTYTNVNDALNAVSSTASAGWNMTTSATGTGVANGSSVAKVAPGATATITAGNNIVTTQNGTDVAIGVNPVLTGLTSVTTGNSTMDNSGVTVNDGTHSATYGATGMAIANGPSVTTTGVNAGGQQITNVAAGTAPNDAATVGQVQAAKAGSVKYDTNADGSINYDSITLNPNGSPTAVHNVAAGTAPTDAANVGQLQQGMQAVQNWSKSYTDHAVNTMGNKAFAGVASAIATANVPQAYQPNQSSAGVGLGNFHGESAISVGVSTISESGRLIFKANASSDTRGNTGIGVGAGVVW